MRTRNAVIAAVSIAAAAGLGGFTLAHNTGQNSGNQNQNQEQPGQNTPPEGMTQEQMMQAWAAANAPNEHHEWLAQLEGEWNLEIVSLNPDMPMESTGTETCKLIAGGRFLHGTVKADMMGQPFSGVSIIGYNNAARQFETIWYDDMSTGLYFYKGNREGNTVTFKGDATDPMTGEPFTVKMVMNIPGKDRFVLEDEWIAEDGSVTPGVRITGTRAGD